MTDHRFAWPNEGPSRSSVLLVDVHGVSWVQQCLSFLVPSSHANQIHRNVSDKAGSCCYEWVFPKMFFRLFDFFFFPSSFFFSFIVLSLFHSVYISFSLSLLHVFSLPFSLSVLLFYSLCCPLYLFIICLLVSLILLFVSVSSIFSSVLFNLSLKF